MHTEGEQYWNKMLSTKHSILFISAEENVASRVEAAARASSSGGFEWTRAEALFDGLRLLQQQSYDLILSDLFLPDGQGLATLRHLKQHAPQTPVIVLYHSRDRDTGVSAIRKGGAYDLFCIDDLNEAHLGRSIAKALSEAAAADNADSSKGAERRTSARFPCRLAVSYQTLEGPMIAGQGTSETLNISSKGVLFTTAHELETGKLVQISVDWPARLENHIPLKLVAEGRIVRCAAGEAAMRIDKYEFRTRRVRTQASPEDIKNRADRPTGSINGAIAQQRAARPEVTRTGERPAL
jgi:CheY-like chemotaxis protein